MEKKNCELCVEVLRRFDDAGILKELVVVGSWCMMFYEHYFKGHDYHFRIRTPARGTADREPNSGAASSSNPRRANMRSRQRSRGSSSWLAGEGAADEKADSFGYAPCQRFGAPEMPIKSGNSRKLCQEFWTHSKNSSAAPLRTAFWA